MAAGAHTTILMAMYNMKGGVAKTTSTLEFAYLLAQDGFKVLLVDADMQANLTTNIIMSSTGVAGAASAASASDEAFDERYDRLWDDINEAEASGEVLRTFRSILRACSRSIIDAMISAYKNLRRILKCANPIPVTSAVRHLKK